MRAFNPTSGQLYGDDSHTIIMEQQIEDRRPEAVKLSLNGLFENGKAVITVPQGVTLSHIAALFDVSVDEIARWNNLPDPNLIQVGQKLTIHQAFTFSRDPRLSNIDPNSYYGTISAYKPNIFEWIHESALGQTWVGKIAYGIVDDAWITLQCFTVGHDQAIHLSGHFTEGQETVSSGINTATLFLPIKRIEKGAKVLNAAQFNAKWKGVINTATKSGAQTLRKNNMSVREINAFKRVYNDAVSPASYVPYIFERDSIR
jgi:LysM repeat protein